MTEKLPVSLTTLYLVCISVVAPNPQRSAAWMVERLREKKNLFSTIYVGEANQQRLLYTFLWTFTN